MPRNNFKLLTAEKIQFFEIGEPPIAGGQNGSTSAAE
jgi:hypothetical protein